MKLMSVADALNMIRGIECMYEDTSDIKVEHPGVFKVKLSEFKRLVNQMSIDNKYKNEKDEYTSIVINGYPMLDTYDLLDSDTISIHMPNRSLHLESVGNKVEREYIGSL